MSSAHYTPNHPPVIQHIIVFSFSCCVASKRRSIHLFPLGFAWMHLFPLSISLSHALSVCVRPSPLIHTHIHTPHSLYMHTRTERHTHNHTYALPHNFPSLRACVPSICILSGSSALLPRTHKHQSSPSREKAQPSFARVGPDKNPDIHPSLVLLSGSSSPPSLPALALFLSHLVLSFCLRFPLLGFCLLHIIPRPVELDIYSIFLCCYSLSVHSPSDCPKFPLSLSLSLSLTPASYLSTNLSSPTRPAQLVCSGDLTLLFQLHPSTHSTSLLVVLLPQSAHNSNDTASPYKPHCIHSLPPSSHPSLPPILNPNTSPPPLPPANAPLPLPSYSVWCCMSRVLIHNPSSFSVGHKSPARPLFPPHLSSSPRCRNPTALRRLQSASCATKNLHWQSRPSSPKPLSSRLPVFIKERAAPRSANCLEAIPISTPSRTSLSFQGLTKPTHYCAVGSHNIAVLQKLLPLCSLRLKSLKPRIVLVPQSPLLGAPSAPHLIRLAGCNSRIAFSRQICHNLIYDAAPTEREKRKHPSRSPCFKAAGKPLSECLGESIIITLLLFNPPPPSSPPNEDGRHPPIFQVCLAIWDRLDYHLTRVYWISVLTYKGCYR
jgi:hypothetical protein